MPFAVVLRRHAAAAATAFSIDVSKVFYATKTRSSGSTPCSKKSAKEKIQSSQFLPLAHEPHKIKTVRRISFPTLEQRRRYLAEANFNVFHLTPSQVTFDMFSKGNSAMTQEQLSGQLLGDEAYAGARSFERLKKAARRVFGHHYCCPAHNGDQGATKLLLAATTDKQRRLVPSNARRSWIDILGPRNVDVSDVRSRRDDPQQGVFTGNVDLVTLEATLRERTNEIGFVGIHACADGMHPISLSNLRSTRALADKYGKLVVLDGSRVIENAWYVQRNESGMSPRSIRKIVRDLAKAAHVLQIDAGQDAKCPTGGCLVTDSPNLYEKLIHEVVVYEGLHTYGGMSGRLMELVARGFDEMCTEDEVQWVMQQTERFNHRLRSAGLPIESGCDGAYIRADEFLPHLQHHQQDAFSAALYETSGVRACALGRVDGRDSNVVPVQIPRLAMTNRQLDQVADTIIRLYEDRDKVPALEEVAGGKWRDQMQYRGIYSDKLQPREFDTHPFIIHTIERIGNLSRDERRRAIEAAGYNTFLLRSADVSVDLLTDSGTSAMSTDQWAAYDGARATPAMSDEYKVLVAAMRDITGYQHIIPVHQGRAAEQILSEMMIEAGQLVPGNMYFTTTKLHQELAGGVFVDIIVDEAHVPESDYPWKGDIDLSKLKKLVDEHGADKIAYISFEHSVNMAGGQPVSMDNMREVYAYCSALHIPVFFDATRMAENALMIQQRDPQYATTKEADILREMLIYGDGCTVSGKKDFLINIGGILAFRDNEQWKVAAEEKLRIYEGSVSNGGLATSDLAAISVGIREMVDDRYIRARVMQTAALGQMLTDAGVPIVNPPGSHAIFLDAKRFLPHIDQNEYPAQRLAAEIYVETGVRAMERGNVSKGRDPVTGENYRPKLELVRLTIPRRVYTNDHMRAVAEGIVRLYQRRHEIKGLHFVYEPEKLRFFQGRFETLE